MMELLGCELEGPVDEPECDGPRDPATTTYEWVKIGDDSVCAGAADGCVDCWGSAGEFGILDVPYRAFDIHWALACGVTVAGEPRCWSWEGFPERIATAPLASDGGVFDGVAVSRFTTCWTRGDGPPTCPVAVCDASGDPADPECQGQPERGGLVSLLGGDYSYCGLDQDGGIVCWGFLPAIALFGPSPFVRLDVGNNICGIDPHGVAWCSGLPNSTSGSSSAADVLRVGERIVQVGAGHRLLLLDESGGVTDVPYGVQGGTEFGYLCEIGLGPYTAVASYGDKSCALLPGGGIECWQEDDAGCITGTPADLMYWY